MIRIALACLALLTACRSVPGEERLGLDPLFTLPLAATIEVPPLDHPLSQGEGDVAYMLSFRFLRGDELVQAPRLTVNPAQCATIAILDQIAFVSDFDVEVKDDAILADPVVDLLQKGTRLSCVVVPAGEEGGMTLAWRIEVADIVSPIRTRTVAIGRGLERVTFQLPAVVRRTVVGRSRLAPGVEARLVGFPGEVPEEIHVSAVPVQLPKGGEEEESRADDEGEPLLARAAEMDPPARSPLLTILVGTVKGGRLAEPLHLDGATGARFLDRVTPLESLSAAMAPEDGARVALTADLRFHDDYEVTVGNRHSILDPVVSTETLGLDGRFGTRDGEPVLVFSFTSLVSLDEFLTTLKDTPVSLERPVIRRKEGVLRIRGEVNVLPIAPLTDGRTVVLVVMRAASG